MIQIEIAFAAFTGEKLIALGFAKVTLYPTHQTCANSPILKLRMDDQASDMTSPISQMTPRANPPMTSNRVCISRCRATHDLCCYGYSQAHRMDHCQLVALRLLGLIQIPAQLEIQPEIR